MKPRTEDVLSAIDLLFEQDDDYDPSGPEFVNQLCAVLNGLGYEFTPHDLPRYADAVLRKGNARERQRQAERTAIIRSVELHERLDRLVDELEALGGLRMIELPHGDVVLENPREYHVKTGEILAAWTELTRVAGPYIPAFTKLPTEIDGFIVKVKSLHHSLGLAIHEHDRREAIAARAEARGPDVVPTGTICSNCHRKPARIDDLCKICARAAGIVVHGKV